MFVRLTGCPLRCGYCDTEYAFHGGDWVSYDDILTEVAQYEPEYVCVTGGEPLSQSNCRNLLLKLCDAGYDVSLETSGAIDIAGLDERITVVMDVKTPGSGEQKRNLLSNLQWLKAKDQVKFVICSREDYLWAKEFFAQHEQLNICSVLFSPSQGQLEPRELAEWILSDRLRVRFQVQLHKYLWGDEAGH